MGLGKTWRCCYLAGFSPLGLRTQLLERRDLKKIWQLPGNYFPQVYLTYWEKLRDGCQWERLGVGKQLYGSCPSGCLCQQAAWLASKVVQQHAHVRQESCGRGSPFHHMSLGIAVRNQRTSLSRLQLSGYSRVHLVNTWTCPPQTPRHVWWCALQGSTYQLQRAWYCSVFHPTAPRESPPRRSQRTCPAGATFLQPANHRLLV